MLSCEKAEVAAFKSTLELPLPDVCQLVTLQMVLAKVSLATPIMRTNKSSFSRVGVQVAIKFPCCLERLDTSRVSTL